MLRDGQSATQLLDKINDMADRIVTGQEKITDATRLALDSIDGEMDNIITHAKSNSVDFQKVVERAAESIEQCASTTRKAHDKELGEEGIDALAAAVASSRNDHITCRTDEAVLKGDETTKCDALKTYVDGLTMPTCTCSDTPVTKQCVTELSTWSATASSTWSTHQGLCNNATTAQSTKRTACNGQQGALESVFCSYKTSLSLVCRTQETCRSDEIALRNKAHESVEVSESAFKAEYESAKHVKCILQVLNATDDAKQGMLSDCRSASVDSSNLTITYPPIPGPANCDRSPVSHPPGDDKWRIDEYQGKTWNADGKAPVVATAANCAAAPTTEPCTKWLDVGVRDDTTAGFWQTQCANLPSSASFLKLEMYGVVDYFKPTSGNDLCAMLTSRSKHEWSKDGITWRVPIYSDGSQSNYGGSQSNWPKDNVDGDSRKYLAFWGSPQADRGGCCEDPAKTWAVGWNKAFTMSYCSA